MNTGKQTLESMRLADRYNRWTINKFKDFLHGNILEVGCGIGNFTKELASYGKVYAIDIDKNYLKYTKKIIGKGGQVGFGNIEAGNYFFNGQKFDTIVCLNVLEHIRNDILALSNLLKLLKSGGKLILLVPSHRFLFGEIDKSIGHYRRYSKQDLNRQLELLGFKVLKSRRLNLIGALGWYIAGKVLKQNTVKTKNIEIFNWVSPIMLPFEDLFEPPIGTSILVIAEKND